MRPDEGLVAEFQVLFNQSPLGYFAIGLWKGTWNGEGDVTYSEATARFTKVPGSERLLPDPGAGIVEGGAITVSWDQEEFTIPGETANGYYLAIEEGGVPQLYAVERDPNVRDLNNAYRVTASMRRRNV